MGVDSVLLGRVVTGDVSAVSLVAGRVLFRAWGVRQLLAVQCRRLLIGLRFPLSFDIARVGFGNVENMVG
jgi:hypothetical protein